MIKKRTIRILSFFLVFGLIVCSHSPVYAEKGHFADVSIVFFPGGSEGGTREGRSGVSGPFGPDVKKFPGGRAIPPGG